MPEEIVERAASLGYQRLGITDDDGLYGIVRAHGAGREHGVEVLVGTEVHLTDQSGIAPERSSYAPTLLLYATDRASYGRLTRLLSLGRLRVGKGGFYLTFDDVAAHAEGLYAIHAGLPDAVRLDREKALFGDRLALAVERTGTPHDRLRLEAAQSAAARFQVPLVATGGVLMHSPERKPLQDILSCIRMGLRLDQAGRRLTPNAWSYLRSKAEMLRLFSDMPEALHQSVEIADRCAFRMDEVEQRFALEVLPEGESGLSYLWKLVRQGALERYPDGVPEDVMRQIEHEMQLIDEMDFSGYFLTVWDIVRFARSHNILCQGRGSAANSVVCYCLGITSIDPVRMNLLFERFISVERGEPPDIDVDFEHERREEVIQYVYDKYGRDHAAMVANFICYRGKMAFREVGKVFGLGEDQLDRISGSIGWGAAPQVDDDILREAGCDPADHTVQQVVKWAQTLQGFPRHLGLHSGGFVITREPLVELSPVENATMPHRTVVGWDKRDIESLGLVKVDLLALGMLTAVHRTFDLVEENEGTALTLATVPAEVPEVYDMVCDADTVGTFQVESRAQMQMLPRLAPRTFYDLVVSVAIVRPGPIQGDMVHPYLRRRMGLEPIEYPHPALEDILGRTYGVPLFQEQVMKMAVAVAGFTPGEADQLRRAIGWQSQIHIDRLRNRLLEGMLKNGLDEAYAERIYQMIKGFGGYGFPESHAASFALIGYASLYLKRFHPAAFLAALLNSQPMGFYAPHSLVADAQRHGVEVRPPCVLTSAWNATLEAPDSGRAEKWWKNSKHKLRHHTPWADAQKGQLTYGTALQPTVRLGFREVFGMSEAQAIRIQDARAVRPFASVSDLMARAELPQEIGARLAAAGAMSQLGGSRREALWKVLSQDRKSPLFFGIDLPEPAESMEGLPAMTTFDALHADYGTLGLSVWAHPMRLVRKQMQRRKIAGFTDLEKLPHGRRVQVGGMATTRQRPSTASGVVFMTLEDEDGPINLVVFSKIYDRYRTVIRENLMLVVQGEVQRTGRVVNVIARHFEPMRVSEPATA